MALALFERGNQIRKKFSYLTARSFQWIKSLKPKRKFKPLPSVVHYHVGESLVPQRRRPTTVYAEPSKEGPTPQQVDTAIDVLQQAINTERAGIEARIRDEYRNIPVSGTWPYIQTSGNNVISSGFSNTMTGTISANGSFVMNRGEHPFTQVEIDARTQRIVTIVRGIGGELHWDYGGPRYPSAARLIRQEEIRNLTASRRVEPVRILGNAHPMGMQSGVIEWTLETISGEVFRS